MGSPASIAKHPFHPMLIVFPVGLWIFSFVADLIRIFGGNPVWTQAALYVMGGGIVGGLLAAVPGFIDFLSLSGRPRKVAALHLTFNLILVILFAVNFYLRIEGVPVLPGPFLLSIIGIILLAVSGWLGGELVYVHGVGVEAG